MSREFEAAVGRAEGNELRAAQAAYEASIEPLSEVAIEVGEQHVIEDMELLSDFIIESSDERLPCPHFGPISTPDLVRQILLNKAASDQQLAAAARELRARLLQHFDGLVMRRANEVSHA